MEPQKNNDLFFTCSLIEYIARKTQNTKKEVVEKLGKETINIIYNLSKTDYKSSKKRGKIHRYINGSFRIMDN